MFALLPFSLVRFVNDDMQNDKNDLKNLLTLNFKALPRLYPMMIMIKYVRMRKLFDYLEFLLQKVTKNVNVQSLVLTFMKLLLLVNSSACAWRMLSEWSLNSPKGWLRADDSMDSAVIEQFISAFYWAVVTCTTVGYGDILPQNPYEVGWAALNILVGVIIFSMFQGEAASQCQELFKTTNSSSERIG